MHTNLVTGPCAVSPGSSGTLALEVLCHSGSTIAIRQRLHTTGRLPKCITFLYPLQGFARAKRTDNVWCATPCTLLRIAQVSGSAAFAWPSRDMHAGAWP